MKFNALAIACILGAVNAVQLQALIREDEAAPADDDATKLAGLKAFGEKLGLDVPDEIMQLGDNATISGALVELAVNAGKSEDEIAAALG